MTGTVDDPRLQHYLPTRIGVERPRVGVPTSNLAMLHHTLELGARAKLPENLLGIARMHYPVVISVEDDRRNDPPWHVRPRRAADAVPADVVTLPHCGKGGGKVAGSAARKAGVHADR